MKHYMIDLETLGTSPGCKILSIGACEITSVYKPREFYREVSRRCDRLAEDSATITWWEDNKTAHTGHILNWDNPDSVHITEALNDLTFWLETWARGDEYCVWSNGADFDLPILVAAWSAYFGKAPWKYSNTRCYRTLKSLAPHIVIPFEGNKHNSLDDALHQTKHALILDRELELYIFPS